MQQECKKHKVSLAVFSIMRLLVAAVLIRQVILHNYEGAFLCVLTMLLLYVLSKAERKDTGNRLAHIVFQPHNELSAPNGERKKPLAEADNFVCPFYIVIYSNGGFEKSRPPFFCPPKE